MTKYTVADIVKSSLEDKPADVKAAFADVMLDKIRAHLEAKKEQMAADFYNTSSQEDDIEDETDEISTDEEGDEEFVDDDETDESEEETDEDAEQTA